MTKLVGISHDERGVMYAATEDGRVFVFDVNEWSDTITRRDESVSLWDESTDPFNYYRIPPVPGTEADAEVQAAAKAKAAAKEGKR